MFRLPDGHVPPRVIRRGFPLLYAFGPTTAGRRETRLPRCPRMRVARGGGCRDPRDGTGWLPVRRLQAHARMSARRDATRGRRRGEPLAGDAGALGEDGDAPIEALVDLNGSLRVTAALRPGQGWMWCAPRVIVLSLPTTRRYLKQKTVRGSSPAGHGRYAGVGSAGAWVKRAL